jgi:hypothetical protein
MTTTNETKAEYEAARDALMQAPKSGPARVALKRAYTVAVKAMMVAYRAAAEAGTLPDAEMEWIAEESESDLARSAAFDAWA